MKFRTSLLQPESNVLANHAQRGARAAEQCRIEIRFSEADNFCRLVKIRVKAYPTSKAARPPQIFATGFSLDKPHTVVRSLEPPLLPRRPSGKVREPIDWRTCGDQDSQPAE